MSGGYYFSVWLHIVAAAIWIGGMLFLGLVLVPALRKGSFESVRVALLHETGVRFRMVGWIVLLILVITGMTNLVYRGIGFSVLFDVGIWQSAWGRLLAWKLGLVGFVLVLSAFHDFYLGPRATRQLAKDPDSEEAQRLRKKASYFGRVTLLISLIILVLAVLLVRGG